MAARVCGAGRERDRLSASACWCGGLFCYRGGARQSAEFRAAYGCRVAVPSREDFEEVIAQGDLFLNDRAAGVWRERLARARPRRLKAAAQ